MLVPECKWAPAALPLCMQGSILMIAMELMSNSSLKAVLKSPGQREELRWTARWVAAPGLSIIHTSRCPVCKQQVGTPIHQSCCRGRQVALDVAEALDHLHTQLGVMHGDLKPA